ncbi:MAG: methyltransferase domain-containing protein [Chloroflexi bacterium]|nr:methyltransferase domain-containing protein [Chloroflexota bacterium]
MATVFMKYLETTPADYDRGIQLLTLNKLGPLKERIASQMVREGDRVLEIGCGTGTLAMLMAQRGAQVTGVDVSPLMLGEARRKVTAAGQDDRVTLIELGASSLTDHFETDSFDVIASTLVFSELADSERRFVLDECRALLAPGGRLIIADEVMPAGMLARLIYLFVRLPLILVTWLLTRTTTHPLKAGQFAQELAMAGFRTESVDSFVAASLQMFVARSAAEVVTAPTRAFPRLQHRVTLSTLLTDLWCLPFRLIPFPKVRPGLYRVGEPDQEAPVLVTGNYDLTVRRVAKAIDGKVNVWLLVTDSAGINVWCAAGGGHFTADKVIAAVKTSGVAEVVNTHALILPQLAANGVNARQIRQETGWRVRWGPVRAEDIPAYLDAGRKKTDAMRQVTFPLTSRLEMTIGSWGLYGVFIAVVAGLFFRTVFWPTVIAFAGITIFYGIFLPWMPILGGVRRGAVMAILTIVGTVIYSAAWSFAPPLTVINWCLGLGFLAFFVTSEFQGMRPRVRTEANWHIEALVGVAALAVHLVLPRIAELWGW